MISSTRCIGSSQRSKAGYFARVFEVINSESRYFDNATGLIANGPGSFSLLSPMM
jgi:hypothetical protein